MDLIGDSLTIGQLAQRAGVGVETLRYYERRHLIPDPPRRRSGYRVYPAVMVARVKFIRRAKELGFSLREIDELLTLRADTSNQCSEVLARTEAKIADISERIASLSLMKKALGRLADTCSESNPSGECPILESLEAME